VIAPDLRKGISSRCRSLDYHRRSPPPQGDHRTERLRLRSGKDQAKPRRRRSSEVKPPGLRGARARFWSAEGGACWPQGCQVVWCEGVAVGGLEHGGACLGWRRRPEPRVRLRYRRCMEGSMAALGDLIIVCAVGFVLIAALSLMVAKTSATPPFARRAPTSGNPQLRQDSNADFLQDRGFLFRRRIWFVGTCCPPVRIDSSHYSHLVAAQRQHPVSVARSGARVWWWFEDSFYWESGSYKTAGCPGADPRPPAPGYVAPGPGSHGAQCQRRPPAGAARAASAYLPRNPPSSLRTRRRPVRPVRQQIRSSIRPPHPGDPRRRHHSRLKALPVDRFLISSRH
jgi:hypothetical protein